MRKFSEVLREELVGDRVGWADAILEEAPILANIPVYKCDKLKNYTEYGVLSKYGHDELSVCILGGEMQLGPDKLVRFGGEDKYFS